MDGSLTVNKKISICVPVSAMLSANYIDIFNKKIHQSILSPTATHL